MTEKPLPEYQAETFAAYLLMPRKLVLRVWAADTGSEQPLVVSPDVEAAGTENFGSRDEFLKAFNEEHARRLARRFKVSVEAMRIRMKELGLFPE